MPQGNDFSSIDFNEVINGTWDFGPWLNVGVTIESILQTSCVVMTGYDQDATNRLMGSADVIQSPTTSKPQAAVIQRWGNMVPGTAYQMEAVVTTSDGQTLALWGRQPCNNLVQ